MYPQELPATSFAKGAAPVGTPVKVFAAYTAPAFSTPAVAIGQVVAAVMLQNTAATAQTGVPFTLGHAFKRGDLAPDCCLAGAIAGQPDLPLQVNVMATHEDGSVRHAIISGVLPVLPLGAVQMGLKSVAPGGAVKAQSVGLPVALPSARVAIGGVPFTASPAGAKFDTWFAGPVASDFIFTVPFVDAKGNPHPTLTAQFSVRAYATGAARIDVAIENTKAYSSTTDVTYDVSIAGPGGGYSQTGLTHFPLARWKKTLWTNTPALHIKHDTAYLIATRAVPNYDQSVTVDEATLAGYASALGGGKFGPMLFGRWAPYMPTTGGRPDIGILPDSYVATILSMDKRAKDMMLAQADTAGSWPGHYRDDTAGSQTQGKPLNVINYPYATILGGQSDSFNPNTGKYERLPAITTIATGSAINASVDSAHQPSIAYLPYLLTGDFYYLDELHFWAGLNALRPNCVYRQFDKALVNPEQLRGQGWMLRTLAQAAAITPDAHPCKQQFVYQYECNMSYYNARYTDGVDNVLGIISNDLSYSVNSTTKNGMSPWQDDFFTAALGHGVELLNFDSAKRLLAWKATFQIGRMTDLAVCVQDAAPYQLAVKPDANSPFFTTLADCYKFTLPATTLALACGSVARLATAGSKVLAGDIDGYPSDPAGYPSQFQPGLAAAVDSGAPSGLQAWTSFMARPTKPSYSSQPQFAVVPRAVMEVTAAKKPAPTTAPTLPPTDAPTAAPTVAPTSAPTAAPTQTPTAAPTPAPTAAPAPVVSYREATLDDLVQAYGKTLNPAAKVAYYFDPAKGIVVLKLTTTS